MTRGPIIPFANHHCGRRAKSHARGREECQSDYWAPSISNLQFAGNILIFCETEMEEIKNVKAVFCFEAASSLKVNLFKSERNWGEIMR